MAGTLMQPSPPEGLTMGTGQKISASFVNSFRVAAVAERLALHLQLGSGSNSTEFFGLCLSLARGIDYAVANNEVPAMAPELPKLLKQVCQRRTDLFLQAAIMVLMISVKNACKIGWFSDNDTQELYTLADKIGNNFSSPGDVNTEPSNSFSIISTVMSRFYPLMTMGQILASLEVKPGYGAYVMDFHISKNTHHSPEEKIRLFVAQKDNIETSACIISPQQVNFLLNGKGVERRINILMDTGPQIPTNVTKMLKYGTNLLQAVGQFNGYYIIVIAFMSMEPLSDTTMLHDYVQSGANVIDQDSDIIEGPSRISINCPISYTRIRIPVKGHLCKHLQCFDFSNFVNINTRRPSWRCPHCNQHVCYTDVRVDQNMVKVLKEVGENVADVIISADGSWKAVLGSNGNVDQINERTLNRLKEGPEQQESTASPIVMDLTGDDDKMDAVDTCNVEDRKPLLTCQIQSVASNLTMPSQLSNENAANQNVDTQIEGDLWSIPYSSHVSVASSARLGAQMVNGTSEPTANVMTSPVMTDSISLAFNGNVGGHGGPNLTSVMQNQTSGSGSFQLQESEFVNSVANEYGRLPEIPRHVGRTPIAIQALPALSRMPIPQQRSRTNLNTAISNGSLFTSQATFPVAPTANGFNMVSSDMDRQQQFPRSHMNQLLVPDLASSPLQHRPTAQNRPHQDRHVIPGQSVQQQVGPPSSTQLPGAYRVPSGLHLHQQVLRMAQSRSQSPNVTRASSPLPRSQAPQGSAQVGTGNPAGNLSSQQARSVVAGQAVQMARQPPSVPVQIPSSRPWLMSHSMNADGIRASAIEQRGNVGAAVEMASGDDGKHFQSEQNWQPTGRMRGSLTGRAYSAFKDLMIQPTQPSQVPRPPSNLTQLPPPSLPPQLQALLANSRSANFPPTQNTPTTESAGMDGSSDVLP